VLSGECDSHRLRRPQERSGDFSIVSQTLRNASTGGDIVASWNGGPYSNVAVSAQSLP
jgi:hypothetical protein